VSGCCPRVNAEVITARMASTWAGVSRWINTWVPCRNRGGVPVCVVRVGPPATSFLALALRTAHAELSRGCDHATWMPAAVGVSNEGGGRIRRVGANR
jgi:hypothetical protein